MVIVGPTSSGKSALAVELAKKFGGEIISADSRQVYRGFDIGTGKVTRREMKGVRHHLLDVASPKKQFSADDFLRRGRAAIKEISSRGMLPIVAGGTGLYIDVLVGRIILPRVPPNLALRARLEQACGERGIVLRIPSPRLCADNAAMIALVGAVRLGRGEVSPPDLDAAASLEASGLPLG